MVLFEFLQLRMTCVRYFMSICENHSLSLLSQCCGLLRLIGCLIVGLCMELMPVMLMMGGRIFQPCCVWSGWSMSYLVKFAGCHWFWDYVVAIVCIPLSEF
jgi:hypothetical protein